MRSSIVAAALLAGAAALPAAAQVSGTYVMDDSHASVTWKIPHLGLAPYVAQFETVNGMLEFNAEDPSQSSITATIAVGSADTDYTGDKDFDAEVVKLLNGAEFPEITFESTAISVTGDNTGEMTGNLTVLGVTKPVTMDVTLTGALDNHPFAGKPALGFTAETVISRSDFGILAGSRLDGGLGNEVVVEVAAEFIQQ